MTTTFSTTPDPDRIRARLAEIIEEMNAETCPSLRVELHLDAQELRAQLAALEVSAE